MRINIDALKNIDRAELKRRLRIFIETLDCHFIKSDYGHSTTLTSRDNPSNSQYDSGNLVGSTCGPEWAKKYAMDYLRGIGPITDMDHIDGVCYNLRNWCRRVPEDRPNIDILVTILTEGG